MLLSFLSKQETISPSQASPTFAQMPSTQSPEFTDFSNQVPANTKLKPKPNNNNGERKRNTTYLISGRPAQSLWFIPELFVLRMNLAPSQEAMPDLTNGCPRRQGLPLFIHRGKLYLWRTKALLHPNLFSVSGLDSKQKHQIYIEFHNPQPPSWTTSSLFQPPCSQLGH